MIREAIEKLDVIYLDEKERLIYEQEQKLMWDEQEKMRTAEERGIEKGVQKGIEKSAIKMLLRGDSDQDIADITDLPLVKIQELRNSLR